MAEYIFSNLPKYIRITPRTDFSNSVVQPNHVLLFSEDGFTLTGKLPDGTFITIGGSSGPDPVGDATSGDILAGKSATVSGGSVISGTIPTANSSSYNPGTSDQVIPAGVYLGGSQTILGDSNLVASNIVSGASIFGISGTYTGPEITLGYITSGGQFQPLAFSGTSAADSGSPIQLSCYSWNLPTFTSGIIVNSGTTLYVSSPYNFVSTTVESGGRMIVLSGGIATATTINNGGYLYVSSGGTAIRGDSGGGVLNVEAGGSAYGFNLSSGYLNVDISSETYISGTLRGSSVFLSGGTVTNMTFPEGLSVDLENGAYAANINITSNAQISVQSGATAAVIYASGSYAMVSVESGGSVGTVYLTSGGDMSLNGGSAYGAHIRESGYGYVRYGGILTSGAVSSGGTLWISGGTASDITISSGGTLILYSYAVTSNITSETGAIIINS